LVGNHIASCLRNETVGGANVSVRPLHRLRFSYFFRPSAAKSRTHRNKPVESGIHSCIAATLAARIENHIALMGADRLYFRSQALKII